MNKVFVLISLLFLLICTGYPQSGRSGNPVAIKPETDKIGRFSVKQLFTKASNYARDQFTELDKKKTPYTKALHRKVFSEQKQLAAKYAGQAKTRENLSGEDFYYLGRLHWLAANATDAAKIFETYLQTENKAPSKKQTARSVMVVVSANNRDFEKAEKILAQYNKSEPRRSSEVAKMNKQLAHSYFMDGKPELAAPFAEETFRVTQERLVTAQSRSAALKQLIDSGITTFEIHRNLGNRERAEAALRTLRDRSIPVQSYGAYYTAIDEHIKYLIETNRKPAALKLYRDTLKDIPKDFNSKSVQAFVSRKFKKRERHYKILGESAPDLISIEKWLPATPQTISDLRGKVVLLDFWATWCGPCIETFPSLISWHEDMKDDGLVILGVTRFYGTADGEKADKLSEIEFINRFKKTQALPYGLAIAYGQGNQRAYGATGIPTAVLIDKKGIVRFVESGTGKSREKEILKMIEKLLAEN